MGLWHGGLWHGGLWNGGLWKTPLGPPSEGLIFYTKSTVDTIGLSVSDYDSIGSIWKSTFFSDPTTPLTVDVADILAHAQINKANVIVGTVPIARYCPSSTG